MTAFKCFLPRVGDVFNRSLCQNGQNFAKNARLHHDFSGKPRMPGMSPGNPWTWDRVKSVCNSKLNVLAGLFAKQCNAIAAQRIRRTVQIVNLYNKIYDKKTIQRMFEKITHNFLRNAKSRPLYFLFSAALFSWDQEKIKDSEIKDCVTEIEHLEHIKSFTKEQAKQDHFLDNWETLIDRDHLKVWRKPLSDSTLYEYKVFGTFYDVPARAFFNVQTDLQYRKQWDKLVITLEKVDEDKESGCEIVHWVTHYPYPMYSREYVFIRKCVIDPVNKVMVLVSRSTDHPSVPASNKYVRVDTYNSRFIIQPHSNFDENGFDYVLSYYDDPQAMFPNAAMRWMASTGVPDFVEKLRVAAKKLHEGGNSNRNTQQYEYNVTSNNQNAVPM